MSRISEDLLASWKFMTTTIYGSEAQYWVRHLTNALVHQIRAVEIDLRPVLPVQSEVHHFVRAVGASHETPKFEWNLLVTFPLPRNSDAETASAENLEITSNVSLGTMSV